MKVENRAPRLITVGGINIIPEKITEIPDKYATHPIIAKMIKNNELVRVDRPKTEAAEPVNDTPEDPAKDFSKMTVKEIEAFAQEHGIDLTGATNKEEKIALVQAAVSGQ